MMRFLVAVDGSEHSRHACAFTAELVAGTQAHIKAIFVRHLPAGAATAAAGALTVAMEEQQAAAGDIVKTTLARCPGFVDTEIREGNDIAACIDAAARDWGADLIVVGSRGLSGAKRLFAGSVSTGLVHHAHVPVLVVR